MHVFVTGGTGLIGSAVVAELLAHDHSVSVLTRSERSAVQAEAAGASAVRGDLATLEVLAESAGKADGVVHLAFTHDFVGPEGLARALAEESAAMAALGEAVVGSGKPFVTVSGTPAVPGRASTEADPLALDGAVGSRARAVGAVLALAGRGVRSAAVRLPRTAHRDGDGGFAGMLTAQARRTGVSGYPGDGTQRWPAVHALDAAVLFRLVLEHAEPGTAWHAVDDEGDAVRDIAAVIGRRLGVPVQQLPEEAFGPFGPIFATDQPASSARTRELLGWSPSHPRLLADLENVRP